MQAGKFVRGSYNSLHYMKEAFGNEIPKLPDSLNGNNFVVTVKTLEANEYVGSMSMTAEEIAISDIGCWTILLFDIDDGFESLKLYRRVA
jgi:hypothetical protein